MGYYISRHSIVRHVPQLEYLLSASERGLSVTFETSHPQRLAYRLRQALKSAEEYPEFTHFRPLSSLYIFKVPDSHTVKAEYQGIDSFEFVDIRPGGSGEENDVIRAERAPDAPFYDDAAPARFDLVVDLMGVMSVVISSEEAELQFPNVILSPDEKSRLYSWTQDAEAEWTYIDNGSNGITLTKKPVPPGVEWTPESPSESPS